MPQGEFDKSLSVCFDRPIHPPLGQPEILHLQVEMILLFGICVTRVLSRRARYFLSKIEHRTELLIFVFALLFIMENIGHPC